MKHWIGAMALTALIALGGNAAIDPAQAATANPAAIRSAQASEAGSQRRHLRATRHTRYVRPYYDAGPAYLGRPVYYAPAPFPLGFGFGFFW